MTCRECHNREEQCGPLSSSGECLECELSAATARDLAMLQQIAENGYEGEQRYSRPVGWRCPECGSGERLLEFGVTMCANCGRIEQSFA